MANPRLTSEQQVVANSLLAEIRVRLEVIAFDDKEYLWALRRKIAKELVYDERGKPGYRVKLKVMKRAEQSETCPICGNELPEKYCVLDRLEAVGGYTALNTRLICQLCDYQIQKERGYK